MKSFDLEQNHVPVGEIKVSVCPKCEREIPHDWVVKFDIQNGEATAYHVECAPAKENLNG